ncbi:phosphoenolpyruvate--protein phosphotransferase [bacterium]|nr:phosphoenolpyruvate--protein phosphotransferase [bacterium]
MEKPYKELLTGIATSAGIAIGRAYILRGDCVKVEERDILEADIAAEITRFEDAVERAKADIKRIRHELNEDAAADIFETHYMLLEDVVVIQETIDKIRQLKKNADFVFFQHIQEYHEKLKRVNHDYFSERATDLADIRRRVIRHLQGDNWQYLNNLKEPRIIVAHELTPSDTIHFNREKVLGFVTDIGGKTSHAAIMSRALEIPAVLGLEILTETVCQNQMLIIDGREGKVIVEPSADLLEQYRQTQKQQEKQCERLSQIKDLPCRTLDGKDIDLVANLEMPEEIDTVLHYGARGIGLYRTEYLFLAKDELPTEEEQLAAYQNVADRLYPDPIIIRTADLGGDKSPASFEIPREDNPFLGWRAIRICLQKTDMFKTQLRAILRVSAKGNVKIMFPMITCVEELTACLVLLDEAKAELDTAGLPYDGDMEVGTMVETPSAAIMAHILAEKIDFLSIGTNDLIQYTLAADRNNERIAYLYENSPPAIFHMIKRVIDAGHSKGVWVGMCGEMARDPRAVLILLGLGLDEFSVNPTSVPEIKNIIRSVSYTDAAQIAKKIMGMQTAHEIKEYMEKQLRSRFSELDIAL